MLRKMAISKTESFGLYVLFLSMLAVCLATTHNIAPQDKSFQTDNDIIENMSKLSSYPSRVDIDNGNTNQDLDSLDSRAFLNKIVTLLEQRKKLPTNWIIHQALLSGQHKRQIRYQQCYFNPISCF